MVASLATVNVRAVVGPRADAAAATRLGRALGNPLLAALPGAFDRLEALDPGGYWVVRDLHVHMSLATIAPDVEAIARAVADALAEGIATAVGRGPGTEVIRFAGRTAYVAAYAAARSVGISGGWVFAPLRTLDALPVPDALVGAARMIDAPVDEAVLAFAEHPSWQRMVDAATPEEADRLVRTLRKVRSAGGRFETSRVMDSLADDLAVLLPTGRRALGAPGVLALLGRAVRGAGSGPHVLDAVLELTLDEEGDLGTRDGAVLDERASHARISEQHRGGEADRPRPRSARVADYPAHRAEEIQSPGATAFVLLPDLAELLDGTALAEPGPAASRWRAELLRSVLGPAVAVDDPGLQLAAGAVPDDRNRPGGQELIVPDVDVGAQLHQLSRSIRADDVLGRQHPDDAAFVTRAGEPADPAVVTVAVALLRRLARHLPGFGEASAAYLIPQVLVPGGRIRMLPGMIETTLVRPPLGVLLALAGLDAFVATVPWLPVPFTVTHEDRP